MCLSVAVRLTVVLAPPWCRHTDARQSRPRITRSNTLRSLATASRVSAAEATWIPSINSESTARGCRVTSMPRRGGCGSLEGTETKTGCPTFEGDHQPRSPAAVREVKQALEGKIRRKASRSLSRRLESRGTYRPWDSLCQRDDRVDPRNGPPIWPETKVTAEGCGCRR